MIGQAKSVKDMKEDIEQDSESGWFKKWKKGRSHKTNFNQLKKNCMNLEEVEHSITQEVELFYYECTLSSNPLIHGLWLMLGFIFAATSLLIWVHMYLRSNFSILYFLAKKEGRPVANFLNELLNSTEIGGATFFSALIFTYFAFYLLMCTLKGLVKFGLRIFIFFPVHPMKYH